MKEISLKEWVEATKSNINIANLLHYSEYDFLYKLLSAYATCYVGKFNLKPSMKFVWNRFSNRHAFDWQIPNIKHCSIAQWVRDMTSYKVCKTDKIIALQKSMQKKQLDINIVVGVDTQLKQTLLLDGVHRSLVLGLLNKLPCVVNAYIIKSDYTHLLFPMDFLKVCIEGRKKWKKSAGKKLI